MMRQITGGVCGMPLGRDLFHAGRCDDVVQSPRPPICGDAVCCRPGDFRVVVRATLYANLGSVT